MNLPFLHVEAAITPGGGSPIYGILPEHVAGVVGVALLPLAAAAVRRAAPRSAWAARLVAGYDALPPVDRLLVWLLAASAVIHVALIGGHGGALGVPFAGVAALLGAAAVRLTLGRPWRRIAVLALLGSLVAYAGNALAGEPPDEVGIATKLIELAALACIWRAGAPQPRRLDGLRRAVGVARVPALVVALAAVAWIGAFAASAREGAAVAGLDAGTASSPAGGHVEPDATGHGHGMVPGPGTLMPAIDHLVPTEAEVAAAEDLHRQVAAAIAKYADTALASADGYQVAGIFGQDFHADNPAYRDDGRILDPAHPETLVYAMAPNGRPVLLGAMFMMPDRSRPGPAVGGPLTVWHAHERLCLGLVPPGLSGLRSPLGACPLGSVEIPVTPEMIHVWVVPDAPTRFGDLDGAWIAAHLERVGAESP